MRVLITGAAGFIGFHLARALKARGEFVIGLDNFNTYYDPRLKISREKILGRLGVEILHADIRNTLHLKNLITQHKISHFVHLAAQAGVRHSLENPEDYVDSNLHGFVSVLEACRTFPGLKLIYASSSSVYGRNKKIPFSPEDPTDSPTNLYGATKKANEVMAHAYHHLYGLSVTGLRYFTAYGPWGRPDMAYYSFAKLISEEKSIQVFNHGNMRRDFTYIDDIIQGTMAAIDLSAPSAIFNLGGNCPIALPTLIQFLEEALGKKAKIEFLPAQPGEVIETFADIEKSVRVLNFRPTVHLEQGIGKFVEWFKEYQSALTSNAIA
jgi:UDP-glucuronate 4-epimerase